MRRAELSAFPKSPAWAPFCCVPRIAYVRGSGARVVPVAVTVKMASLPSAICAPGLRIATRTSLSTIAPVAAVVSSCSVTVAPPPAGVPPSATEKVSRAAASTTPSATVGTRTVTVWSVPWGMEKGTPGVAAPAS